MTAGSNAPVIIKRRKIVGGDGHHGGAWKVAYADFVTAMMAFFMLMWLLNATTEQQRKGIADYFSPTVPINRISGGGDGAFGGSSIFSDQTLARDGTGASNIAAGSRVALAASETPEDGSGGDSGAEVAALTEIEEVLLGRGGESFLSDEALRHVITRLTDEGLIIEVFDLPGAPLFEPETGVPRPVTREIAAMLARTLGLVENGVTVEGHIRARPIVLADNPDWPLSLDRAAAMRDLLEDGGLAPQRMLRVTGHADRKPADPTPMALRNNRIEVVVLRSDQR